MKLKLNLGSARDSNRPIADHVLIELGWLLALVLILVVLVIAFAMYRSSVLRDVGEAELIARVVAPEIAEFRKSGLPARERIVTRLDPAIESGFVAGWTWYDSGGGMEKSGLVRLDEAEEFRGYATACFSRGECASPLPAVGYPWAPRPFVVAGYATVDGKTAGALFLWAYPHEAAFADELRSPVLIAYLITVVMLLTALGWWRLRTLIALPLSRLINSMKQVERGDLATRASEITCREMVELTGQFNQMTSALEAKSHEIARRVNELESAYSELERARDETIQSEKLAGVGRLAAGIAHEVGNPLAAMTGFAELLEDDSLDSETRRDLLKRIQSDLARTDRIIRGLLDYARPGRKGEILFEVSQVVSQSIALCRGRRLFDRVEVNYTSTSNGACRGDPGQIEQIIVNLMLNAVDAMNGSGRLDVSVRDSADRRSVEIRVKDSGTGIRKEDLLKVFDPFFTTKEPGKGTGLGLAVSSRIAGAHGGTLEVEATAPSGTVFLLRLPRIEPAGAEKLSG